MVVSKSRSTANCLTSGTPLGKAELHEDPCCQPHSTPISAESAEAATCPPVRRMRGGAGGAARPARRLLVPAPPAERGRGGAGAAAAARPRGDARRRLGGSRAGRDAVCHVNAAPDSAARRGPPGAFHNLTCYLFPLATAWAAAGQGGTLYAMSVLLPARPAGWVLHCYAFST